MKHKANTITAKVIKLSICSCGFPLFNDDVKIGMEYEMDRARTFPNIEVECGGCGMLIPSTFIWCLRRVDLVGIRQMPGWIPMEAFDL
jgi:hypothetical protein